MSRITIPRADANDDQGCWWPVERDGIQRAVINCPQCGEGAYLGHAIAADGTVTPSVVCPGKGCGWHVFAQLADWDGGDVPVEAG